jgi:hypothetical protein
MLRNGCSSVCDQFGCRAQGSITPATEEQQHQIQWEAVNMVGSMECSMRKFNLRHLASYLLNKSLKVNKGPELSPRLFIFTGEIMSDELITVNP